MGNVDLSRFLLIEAPTAEAVLQQEEALLPRLRALQADGALEFYQGLSPWIPSEQTQRVRREALHHSLVQHGERYRTYFDELGFAPETYTNLLQQFATSTDPLTIETWEKHEASKRFHHLWLGEVDERYASLVLLGGLHDFKAMAELERDVPAVTFVNKVDDVSALFTRYRKLAGWLVVGSHLVIGLLLFQRYGARRAPLVFLPPCIAAALTLGMLGHFAQPITLFNGLALLLVLGIGIDYTLFFAEARSDVSHIMLAIMLSAFTTLLSFGLLALSETQALSRFGLTLLIGITLALLFAPMAAGAMGPSVSEHES